MGDYEVRCFPAWNGSVSVLAVPTEARVPTLGVVSCDRMALDGDTWWLSRAWVHEDQRGRGLGSLLLKRAQAELVKVPEFRVLVVEPGGYNSLMADLVRFYMRHGFVGEDDNRGVYFWRAP